MICKKCNSNIPDKAKFCPKCGEKAGITENLKDSVLCPKCGTANPPTAKFCRQDGAPLQKIPPPKEEIKTEAAPVLKAEEKPKDIICPKCGTANPLTAKFCRKDGTPLQAKKPDTTQKIEPISDQAKLETIIEPKDIGTKPVEKEIKLEPIIEPKVDMLSEVKTEEIKAEVEKQNIEREIKPEEVVSPRVEAPPPKVKPKPEIKNEVEKKPSRAWIWITVGVLVFVAAGVGGYLYFFKPVEKKPTEITVKPVEPEKPTPSEPKVTEEAAKPPAEIPGTIEPTARELVRPPETKIVSPPAMPKSSKQPVDIARLERDLNRSLRTKGLSDIYAEVDKGLVATLMGTAQSQEERNNALDIARSYRELRDVRDNIQVTVIALPPLPSPDPAKLEGDINRAMRNAGLSGVTAVVNDNFEVTLKGSVGSNYEKNRAFDIAKSFKDAKRIRDIIFVVEQ
ncbi:MAG: zinc ribbon domain-containing protein [Nitrospirota bacterium]